MLQIRVQLSCLRFNVAEPFALQASSNVSSRSGAASWILRRPPVLQMKSERMERSFLSVSVCWLTHEKQAGNPRHLLAEVAPTAVEFSGPDMSGGPLSSLAMWA